MRKLPDNAALQPATRHKPAKSRLPSNRLLEAKVLNEQTPRGRALRRSLFPKAG